MNEIKHKILVLSGKGGVGKSTIAMNLAYGLAKEGKVGLLDVDIHGPSIPVMGGLEGRIIAQSEKGFLPVEKDGIFFMSVGFMLESPDSPLIWRGPMKASVINSLINETDWGKLDYLVVDAPPGTGDEPLSICQLLPAVDGAVIVTTPQKVAEVDVLKSISFCNKMAVPILGLVENMSGFICPKCGEMTQIFPQGAGDSISEKMNIPLLGRIPMDFEIAESGDFGDPFVKSGTDPLIMEIFAGIISKIKEKIDRPFEEKLGGEG